MSENKVQVALEETSSIGRTLTITILSDSITHGVNERLKKYAKKAKVNGFRPGKVPFSVVQKLYQKDAEQEVLNDLIEEYYTLAIKQESIMPIAILDIKRHEYRSGENFTFEVNVEVYPQITNPTIEGCEIKKPIVGVKEEDVERTLGIMRKNATEYIEKEGDAEDGDQVVVDFEGSVDGEKFEGGKGDNISITLGEGKFLPDLEKSLYGKKIKDNFVSTVVFPEDYFEKNLAGKTTEFNVTITKVSSPKKPEIDDDFAIKNGIKEGGVDELKTQVANHLSINLKSKTRSELRKQVLDALYKNSEIDPPKSMVAEEVKRADKAIQERAKQQGADINSLPKEKLEEDAKKHVVLSLLMHSVIDEQKIIVDDSQVKARVEEMAEDYGNSEEFKNWCYENKEQLDRIKSEVLENQVIDHLLESATISEYEISYKDFMGQ